MKFNPQIHSVSHILKSIIGSVVYPLNFFSPNQLIVLNYHGTQKKFISNFEEQLNYLSKHYHFTAPNVFFEMLNGNKKNIGKHILLTFDDGIKNNLEIIPILNKKGISACFFVVPNFIDTPIQQQKDYFIKNIRPLINPAIDNENIDFEALSWDDLKLIKTNHLIGCHTLSHSMQKDILNDNELINELIVSKQKIETKLNMVVDSFCSINNTLLTIGKNEFDVISKHYTYHFTTFGGNNLIAPKPLLIKRINVEAHWLKGAFKFALSPVELNRWKKIVAVFEKIVG